MSKRAFENSEIFENKFKEYLDFCEVKKRLPNVAGFAVYANINQDTFYAQRDYYSETFKRINDMLEDEALNCKDLNDTRVIFYMKNKCGYKDKIETQNENKNVSRIQIVNDLGENIDTTN